jgi:hypothetical protein
MSSLEYAQARLSARFGARPTELDWRRIEHVRGFAALIEAMRTPAFNAWMTGIGPMSSAHEIELRLRSRWRELAGEVRRWMPGPWQPAVAWCERLPDLPFIDHLARGGATLPWMRDDAVFRELGERGSAGGPSAPVAGPFAPLAAAWQEPGALWRCWRDEWHRRRPQRADGEDREREPLDQLAATLGRHLGSFRDPLLTDGWPLRRALQAELVLLFRRAMLDPAAAFAFLALAALDLERLRGELLRRAAFPGVRLTG